MIDDTISEPSPGQAKTFSTSTVPAIMAASSSPQIVSVAVSAFGRTCSR